MAKLITSNKAARTDERVSASRPVKGIMQGNLSAPSPDASNRAPMHHVDRHISDAVMKKGHPTGHARKR